MYLATGAFFRVSNNLSGQAETINTPIREVFTQFSLYVIKKAALMSYYVRAWNENVSYPQMASGMVLSPRNSKETDRY